MVGALRAPVSYISRTRRKIPLINKSIQKNSPQQISSMYRPLINKWLWPDICRSARESRQLNAWPPQDNLGRKDDLLSS